MSCKKCGAEMTGGSRFCLRCGAIVSPEGGETPTSPKSWATTALLALPCLFGPFGAHRFYAGKTRTALIMLGIGLTGLVCIGMGVLTAALDLDSPWGISVPFLIAFLVNFLFLPLFVWATIDLIVVLTDNFKDGQGRTIKRW
jgi:TM2 domain-containing membrane protein YozV